MIVIEPLIGIKDLSEVLGINHYTIYKKIKLNEFPNGIKYNGKRVFRLSDIEGYLTSLDLKYKIVK